MIAGIQKGKEIRRYFLECERIAKLATEVTPAQSARIREPEVELELARATDSAARSQERLVLTTQVIATPATNLLKEAKPCIERSRRRSASGVLVGVARAAFDGLASLSNFLVPLHGCGMVALILGKPDAMIETPPTIVEKTVLVNPLGKPIATYQGISKTKLAKRYGMKETQELVNWLQSIGKTDLLQPGMAAAPCQFVPWKFVKELDCFWSQRHESRQRLLGE